MRQQQQHLRARFGFHVGDGASPTSSVVLDGIRSGGLIGGSGTRTAPGDEGDAARFAAAASTADIVDVLVGVREDFSAAAGEGGSASSSGGLGAGSGVGAGASKGSGATSDLFSSPAFASGRVFSFATLDGLLTEAHFAPHTVPVIKQLIRAARLHRLFLLPVADAVTMARVAASVNRHAGARDARAPVIAAAALERARAAVASEAAARAVPRGDGAAPPTSGDDAFDRYGLLFEALLRAWRLLPIGLYRRVHPASGLRVPREAAAAVAAAVGPPPPPGALFAHAHTAVSYVVVNALPDTVLSPHDYVYVMSGDDEED